jgi:hypothetical protein
MEFSRYYTVAEVNDLLPEIRRQIEQLQIIKKEHQAKLEELQELKLSMLKNTGPSLVGTNEDPFFALECSIDFLQLQARQILKQFGDQEIMVKSIDAGLVDFPAKMNGEVVLLCWLKDEPSVLHYHGLNDGFWGRRKLDEGDLL